jgi:addiction module HigA family antidote
MIPTNRIPTHPGVILLEEFLEPLNLTQVALANHLNIPVQRINEIIRGKRGITPETAWLLAQAFNTTPQFWLNLQINYDLALSRPKEIKQPITSTVM